MFADLAIPNIGKISFKPNSGFNHVIVNKTGHIYGFKFLCYKDTEVILKELKSLFEASGLEELSFFHVKSKTSSSTQEENSLIKCNDMSVLSGTIIEDINDSLYDKSFSSTKYFESIYVCSNQEIEKSLFHDFIKILSLKGLVLSGLDQDELLDQLSTWVSQNGYKLSHKKGKFRELAFSSNKGSSQISSPLLALKSSPTTSLHQSLNTKDIGYKLITCCYFFKIEGSIYTRSFHGIRIYSAIQKIGDPYKFINKFLLELSHHKVPFYFPEDGKNQYLSMIPGVFHTNNLFIKTSIKNFNNALPHTLVISQNDFDSMYTGVDTDKSSDYAYPVETINNVYTHLDLTSKNVVLSGVRDDYYKSLVIQEIAMSVDRSEHVIVLDPTGDLDYMPMVFNGKSYTSPLSFKKLLLNGLDNIEHNQILIDELGSLGLSFNNAKTFINESGMSSIKSGGLDFLPKDVNLIGSLTLLKPNGNLDSFLFVLVLIELLKTNKLRVIIHNADSLSSLNIYRYLTSNLKKYGSGSFSCFGSSRIFDDIQKSIFSESDICITRGEIPLISSFKPYEVLDLSNTDDAQSGWFSVSSPDGNMITKIPVLIKYSCLYNTSLQSEHMVYRMAEAGALPNVIFDKLCVAL